MKQYLFVFYLVTLSLLLSCREEVDCCVFPVSNISGTWALYEYGYSVGDKNYYVAPVPLDPLQSISFSADNIFSSTVEGLSDFKYYMILDDRDADRKVLALFKADPSGKNYNINEVFESYNIDLNIKHDNLKLHHRFCTEGCHLGFKKMQD